jgi:hypothetical protein
MHKRDRQRHSGEAGDRVMVARMKSDVERKPGGKASGTRTKLRHRIDPTTPPPCGSEARITGEHG